MWDGHPPVDGGGTDRLAVEDPLQQGAGVGQIQCRGGYPQQLLQSGDLVHRRPVENDSVVMEGVGELHQAGRSGAAGSKQAPTGRSPRGRKGIRSYDS